MMDVSRSRELGSQLLWWCRRLPTQGAIAAVMWALVACSSGTAEIGPVTAPGSRPPADADEVLIVNCLLPGQLRPLGGGTMFIAPRQQIKTSARDCQIRGGTYIALDRGDSVR
jgi:hypothetical protein